MVTPFDAKISIVLVPLRETNVGVAGDCIERLCCSADDCKVLPRGFFFVHHDFCLAFKSPARINGYRGLAPTSSKIVSIFSDGVLRRTTYAAIMSNSFGYLMHVALYSTIYLRTTFPS